MPPGLPRLLCIFLLTLSLRPFTVWSQVESKDTTRVLEDITVYAYEANRDPRQLAASVDVVLPTDFDRFSKASPLPAFNLVPGVRMEERSPGSYRFSIRGSLLRSPFGIRNVKFYWNSLPFTDAGGNTYLNLIDLAALGRTEVIKGPASSLYGAGTGGAVLLQPRGNMEPGLQVGTQAGSFGAVRLDVSTHLAWRHGTFNMNFANQGADGYRDQTEFRRNFLHMDYTLLPDQKNRLRFTLLYSRLRYETPGGLTWDQFQADPRQARPPTATLPGAVEQQAGVSNETWLGGIDWLHLWNDSWNSHLSLLGSSTDFSNPALLNYETRQERNFGIRLTNTYAPTKSQGPNLVFGAEYQHFAAPIEVRHNAGGMPGTQVISNDDVTADTFIGFVQGEVALPYDFSLTVGGSINLVEYVDKRLALSPVQTYTTSFSPILSPRVALLHRINPKVSAFASVSRGFSPPTLAEVVPSTGVFNPALRPESGWSYEAGLTMKPMDNFSAELSVYDFRLTNTIVLQRDSSGADYFVNAGDTRQPGAELSFQWGRRYTGFLKTLRSTLSLTYTHYTFGNYVNDGNDYSGNQVTGVSPFILATGIDLTLRSRMYLMVTAQWVDRIPLNDANTEYAPDYFLLGFRSGYRSENGQFELYVGVDNAMNQRYSLGNDLNAAGRRYYNAAPSINYYAGLSFRWP